MLSKYIALHNQSKDMVGWISIEGTVINYLVMHTPENPDFYLKHSFEQEYSDYGVPYVAGNCQLNPRSDNIIIYGHHMKNGTMFGKLTEYADELLTLSTCEYSSKNGRMVVVGKIVKE